MKKIFLLFSLHVLAAMITVCTAQSFMEYTINGVNYKADGEKITSYTSFNDDYDKPGKRASKTISADVSGIYGLLFTIKLDIHIDTNLNFTPGTWKLGENIAFLKTRPIGYIQATKYVKGDRKYEFYESQENAKGFITITKVKGDWVEGTFEADLIGQYPLKDKTPLKVTKGKFRLNIEMLE